MSKASLVDAVANDVELTKKQADAAVDAVFNAIRKAVKADGKFSLVGFGTFALRKRAARMGRNPQTGDPIKVKASKSVAFKVGKDWKSKL